MLYSTVLYGLNCLYTTWVSSPSRSLGEPNTLDYLLYTISLLHYIIYYRHHTVSCMSYDCVPRPRPRRRGPWGRREQFILSYYLLSSSYYVLYSLIGLCTAPASSPPRSLGAPAPPRRSRMACAGHEETRRLIIL